MKKLIKYILLGFFFLGINQSYASIEFTGLPITTNCASTGDTPDSGVPTFSIDGTKMYYSNYTSGTNGYQLKSVNLTIAYDCSSYSSTPVVLYTGSSLQFSRMQEYNNYLYVILSGIGINNLIKFDLVTNTYTTLYTNSTKNFSIDIITGNLYINTSGSTIAVFNLSGGGFESVGTSNTTIFTNFISSSVYNNVYYINAGTTIQCTMGKYNIINTLGNFTLSFIENDIITGNCTQMSGTLQLRVIEPNHYSRIQNSAGLKMQKYPIINDYVPPVEFNLAYIQSQPPQQLYSGFKTYIQSIYDIDSGNDISNNVFYYIEYLTGTGSEYPLTTSNFNVGLTPQTVTFPYHTLIGDYKATAKFLFNEVEYNLFEFNYNIVEPADPSDAQIENCNIFDYDCNGEVGVLNGEFLKGFGNWFSDLISFSIITDKLDSINEFFEGFSPTQEIKTFSFIPSVNAGIMSDFNQAYESNSGTSLFQKIIGFLKWGTAFLVLIFLLSGFYHLKHKQND